MNWTKIDNKDETTFPPFEEPILAKLDSKTGIIKFALLTRIDEEDKTWVISDDRSSLSNAFNVIAWCDLK